MHLCVYLYKTNFLLRTVVMKTPWEMHRLGIPFSVNRGNHQLSPLLPMHRGRGSKFTGLVASRHLVHWCKCGHEASRRLVQSVLVDLRVFVCRLKFNKEESWSLVAINLYCVPRWKAMLLCPVNYVAYCKKDAKGYYYYYII